MIVIIFETFKKAHLLSHSCQPITNECFRDPLPDPDYDEASDLLQVEIDDNILEMGFDAVKLWNQETASVWPNFLRLDCLHKVMVNFTLIIVDCHLTATLVETNCKKSELLDGDLADLDASDLDSCVDLPNRYNCIFQLKFNQYGEDEKNRIQLTSSQCLRIDNDN